MIPRYQTNKQNLWKIEGREGPQKGLGEDESPGCHSRRPSWSLLNRFQGFPDLWQRDIYIHLVRVVAFITWHHHPQPVCLFNFLLYFPIQLCILLYKKWNFWRFFHFSFFICGPTHCSTLIGTHSWKWSWRWRPGAATVGDLKCSVKSISEIHNS